MTKKILKKRFSFDDFLKVCKGAPNYNAPGNSSYESGKGRKTWTGTYDYDEALQLVDKGYPQGVKKMQKEMENLKQAKAPQLSPSFDVAGDEADVDRFLQNDPENMITFEHTLVNGIKFLDVYFSYAYSHVYNKTEVIKRGVQILSNVDNLEQLGYRVRIIAYHYSIRNDQKFPIDFQIVVKDYQEHVELDRMAYVMAHPSMLRRLGFRLVEKLAPKLSAGGYGAVHDLEIEDAVCIGPNMFAPDRIDREFEKTVNTE